MLHGLGIASRMCRPVANRLASRYTVHALDLPGFGESDKPPRRVLDIADLAESVAAWMGIASSPPAIVVGTSLGSQVATELANRHPGRCRAVALVSPIVDADRRSWPRQLVRWPVEQMTHSMQLRWLMTADYTRCGISRVARTFSRALDYRLEDVVSRIETPMLVCWGTRDPLVSRTWAETIVDRARDAQLAVIPGASHNMSHENPLELARVLTRFIGEVLNHEPDAVLTRQRS